MYVRMVKCIFIVVNQTIVTKSYWQSQSYWNQSVRLQCKSSDWFLDARNSGLKQGIKTDADNVSTLYLLKTPENLRLSGIFRGMKLENCPNWLNFALGFNGNSEKLIFANCKSSQQNNAVKKMQNVMQKKLQHHSNTTSWSIYSKNPNHWNVFSNCATFCEFSFQFLWWIFMST